MRLICRSCPALIAEHEGGLWLRRPEGGVLVFRDLPYARCGRCGAEYGRLDPDAPSLAPMDFRVADGAPTIGLRAAA